MPLLDAQDPLPGCPRRIVVAGTSGSGKTTLAVSVSELLRVPAVEIDDLFNRREWWPRNPLGNNGPPALGAEPGWVTEWQFSQARAMVATGADLLLWLDLGRWRVTQQVAGRTLRRALLRKGLSDGDVPPPVWAQPPDRHLLRWARSTHHKSAERVTALLRERPDLPVVRLPTRQAVERWVAGPLRDTAARCGGSGSEEGPANG